MRFAVLKTLFFFFRLRFVEGDINDNLYTNEYHAMMRHAIICGAVLIILVLVAILIIPIFAPWTPINCRHQDVDIRTGRVREMRYLLYCKMSDYIKESPISNALPKDFVENAEPEWHRVNTLSPGVHHSPHYIFHSALFQMHSLASIWNMNELPDILREKTAFHLLALWQYAGDDSLADEYLSWFLCFNDFSDPEKREKLMQNLDTLKMPRIETNGNHVIKTFFFPNGQPMEWCEGYSNSIGGFVLDGYRFQWDIQSKLTCIDKFTHGVLSEHETKSLEQHPEYKAAQKLLLENDQPTDSSSNMDFSIEAQ
jgi:hypothetical protein